MGTGGLCHDDVGPVSGDVIVSAQRADELGDGAVQRDLVDDALCPADGRGLTFLVVLPTACEPSRVGVVVETTTDDLGAGVRVGLAVYLDAQSEPVEQLGSQPPLLRVHGPDQDEAACQSSRQPFSLHPNGSGAGVDDEVDEVVVKEVDLVDVEHPTVDLAEQPGLQHWTAGGQGGLQIQPTDETVLGGPQGQGPHHLAWQQLGQTTDHRRLGRPLLPAEQHPANARVDGAQQQGAPGLVLPDDGGERVGHQANPSPARSSPPSAVTDAERVAAADGCGSSETSSMVPSMSA